jgi:hypothetical protein
VHKLQAAIATVFLAINMTGVYNLAYYRNRKLHLELLITKPLQSLLTSASIAMVGHGCFHSALVATSNEGLQNKHHIANFQ